MIKYFTKEYIAECDCEEIQKSKHKLQYGDWVYSLRLNGEMTIWATIIPQGRKKDNNETWLPTGDQLDEEIIKIFKTGYNYNSSYCQATKTYVSYIEPDYPDKELTEEITVYGDNFLIAKIKLLKELLK